MNIPKWISLLLVACTPWYGLWAQEPAAPLSATLATPFRIELPTTAAIIPDTLQGPFGILDVVPSGEKTILTLVAYDTGTFSLQALLPAISGLRGTLNIIAPPPDSVKNYRPAMEVLHLYPPPGPAKTQMTGWKKLWWLLPLLVLAIWVWKQQRKPALPPIPAAGTEPGTLLQNEISRWQQHQTTDAQLGAGLMQVLYLITTVPRPVTISGLRKILRQQQPHLDNTQIAHCMQDIDSWRFGKGIATQEQVATHRQLLEHMITFMENTRHA